MKVESKLCQDLKALQVIQEQILAEAIQAYNTALTNCNESLPLLQALQQTAQNALNQTNLVLADAGCT